MTVNDTAYAVDKLTENKSLCSMVIPTPLFTYNLNHVNYTSI